MKSIGIFCGSSIGRNKSYLDEARRLGELLAHKGIKLIYGGANVGLMGMVAKSCLEKGGDVIGVMTDDLMRMDVAHPELTELKVVPGMHERKSLIHQLSDGFISLPGGIGTIEETMELLTWMQLGIHQKPIALLNIEGFYDTLIEFLEHAVNQGFLRQEHLDALIIDTDAGTVLQRMEDYKHIPMDKWFDKEANRV